MSKFQWKQAKLKKEMDESGADKKPSSAQQKPQELYGEQALWQCKNLSSGIRHHINGALAQILKRYPTDYELTFLSPRTPEGGR